MNSFVIRAVFVLVVCLWCCFDDGLQAQAPLWHGIERGVHYQPDGNDFVLVQGSRKFNRALYGGNTAFRAEAGDLPEFALYLPGMGGNLKFGLIKNGASKWLTNADSIETRYQPGSMIYKIRDSLLGKGFITIEAIAPRETEALLIKMTVTAAPPNIELLAAYGGATGIKFSRDGDIGADPESSFYLKPEYCKDNIYQINKDHFTLYYGSKSLTEEERYEIQTKPLTDVNKLPPTLKKLSGIFPSGASLTAADPSHQESPLAFAADTNSVSPALAATLRLSNGSFYFLLQNGETSLLYDGLDGLYLQSEKERKKLSERIKISTPDPYINTLGGALAVAADAVWEAPSFLHGAVAWRMRLPGWRGAYLADVLGWHDRARMHFDAYASSQVTEPASGPVVMDTALNLARHAEKMGTSVFTSGYISRNPGGDKRPHHYDMNLVFVDQLLNHLLWTGDTSYVKTMWPLLKRHLAWEDRNFDADGDHLYDAYAAIWASDALQYSGGGVTHSSAYNYKAYQIAAGLATLVGEDPSYYQEKARGILNAINTQLWVQSKGVYAEYKDLLGARLLHSSPAIWTIYHAIDSKVPDRFQAYQSLQYIDNYIPHIPIRAKGLCDSTLYTISTSNWQPYTWSLNNVSLGEIMHTSLAYWQGGRSDEAFLLWKSGLVESMYVGASPGNFQQLSFYDAVRGELYRDFADDIGMTARSLVEGLFGVFINRLHDTIHVSPGFPKEWKKASIQTPDFSYRYLESGSQSSYQLNINVPQKLNLSMSLPARREVEQIFVNGIRCKWFYDESSIEMPRVKIMAPASKNFQVVIKWKAGMIGNWRRQISVNGQRMIITFPAGRIIALHDPSHALQDVKILGNKFSAVNSPGKSCTFFLKLKQGRAIYWSPVTVQVVEGVTEDNYAKSSPYVFDKIELGTLFNEDLTNIFKNQYLSPRPTSPTLQLPTQGIGNWAYPSVKPVITDSGLRKKAGAKNEFTTQDGIPFSTPSQPGTKNIVFVSQWDNYPDSTIIPLKGKAWQAHLLMAGTTNAMQSRMVNGKVVVTYADGSQQTLELKNPENWWPIEQDFYDDGYAFTTDAPKPLRVHLKTGIDTKSFANYTSIKGFTNRAIEGGAATVLNLPLNPTKELKSLTLSAITNDVVIGLMSLTLAR